MVEFFLILMFLKMLLVLGMKIFIVVGVIFFFLKVDINLLMFFIFFCIG